MAPKQAMIPIQLYYGPLDGLHLEILDYIWDRGWVIVPVANKPVFEGEDSESCIATSTTKHFYVKKEIGKEARGTILDPIYQWVYDSTT